MRFFENEWFWVGNEMILTTFGRLVLSRRAALLRLSLVGSLHTRFLHCTRKAEIHISRLSLSIAHRPTCRRCKHWEN
jgi:hypothetical protein